MKLTIRLRVALLCGGLSLLWGAVLLLVVYLLLRSHLRSETEALIRAADENTGLGSQGWLGSTAHHAADTTMDSLLFWGVITIVLVSAAAGWFGWLAAGWVLRSLNRVTETARRVAQSHDLTERIDYTGPPDTVRELADIFDTMVGRLARAFDGQRRFVANASHELRTPLAINRTLVDVAVRRADATEEMKRLGESLLVVNTRHERLIDGLLALAEGEQTVLDRRPLDLTDVVEHVLDQVADEAEEQTVTLHRLMDTAPTAGDAILLERIAQNLVENAIRHNHSGGEVWVTTRQRGDLAELVVANTGLAVPPYEIETIFEPFRRLHADRLRSDRGSGLGLSIVRAIVDAHSGTIIARPREEGGLTITVELPAA
ncbi:HAMP domain-containing sensor histidine kinase [Actinoallomurus oryzae]|uniref:histidine kinase n=1 Tax=Actinoallomurus oryzae TaxID=502180 RepID=A0ABP8PL17_9ACTN